MKAFTRIGALALALAMTLSLSTTALAASTTFTDIPEDYWAYSQIEKAYKLGIVGGTSHNETTGERTYSPYGTTTLAQLIVMVTRYLYPTEVAASTADGAWYAANLDVAQKHGLLQGFENADPTKAATREQLVTILYNAEGRPAADASALAGYTDEGAVSSFAADAFAWAVAKGVINGTSATELSPSGTATRAQVAVILIRYIEGIQGTGTDNSGTTTTTPANLPYKSAEEIIATMPVPELAYWYADNFYLTNPDEVNSKVNVDKRYQTIGYTEKTNQNGYRTNCTLDVSGAVLDYDVVDVINDIRTKQGKPVLCGWAAGDTSEEYALALAKFKCDEDNWLYACTAVADSLEEAAFKLYDMDTGMGPLTGFIGDAPYVCAAHYTDASGKTTYSFVCNDDFLPFVSLEEADGNYRIKP